MSRVLTSLAVASLLLAIVAVVVMTGSHRVAILKLAWLTMSAPDLGEPTDEGIEAIWFDDYFSVFRIDEDSYAIGETRYHQMNFNYLLLGRTRAVLFDSGPGIRDIVPVVRSITSLPVTSAASHLHYDHVGRFNAFDSSAMIDLPALRERAKDGRLALRESEHLGGFEDIDTPTLRIDEWWSPGQEIDLGGRRLIVLHTPGHTPESMILQDPDRDQFFTGDSYYPGDLFAFLPGSSLGDYARTTDRLLKQMNESAVLFGGHRQHAFGLPTLSRAELVEVQSALHALRDGTPTNEPEQGIFPRELVISKRISLLMDFAWGRHWD